MLNDKTWWNLFNMVVGIFILMLFLCVVGSFGIALRKSGFGCTRYVSCCNVKGMLILIQFYQFWSIEFRISVEFEPNSNEHQFPPILIFNYDWCFSWWFNDLYFSSFFVMHIFMLMCSCQVYNASQVYINIITLPNLIIAATRNTKYQ